jgi:hypothetical protein
MIIINLSETLVSTYLQDCRLGGVLAIGSKVCGFKTGRGDGFLKAIKIRSTPSFGGGVKTEAPRRKILWQV